MGKPYPKRFCVVCESVIGQQRNSNPEQKFCSKKCEIDIRIYNSITESQASRLIPIPRLHHAILGDTHKPWRCEKTVLRFIAYCKKEQPDIIVQVGDLYDMFSATRFPRRHFIAPKDEMDQGYEQSVWMWKELRLACPKSQCIQLLGNHDERPYKRMIEKVPELEAFFDFHKFFVFDGVKTVYDFKVEIVIDNVCYQHGFRKQGAHVSYNLMNSVHGHTHRAGVTFMNVRGQTMWELDVGYAANPEAEPLVYRQQKLINWTKGFGEIKNGSPKFYPL